MKIITNFTDLDLTKQYTYADYLLWQFTERVELIKGFICKMTPVPNQHHQKLSQNIAGNTFFNGIKIGSQTQTERKNIISPIFRSF